MLYVIVFLSMIVLLVVSRRMKIVPSGGAEGEYDEKSKFSKVKESTKVPLVLMIVSIVGMILTVIMSSVVSVPADKVGIVRKLYGSTNLPDGHIIATNGETGYQAQIIPPGAWRFSLFFNIFYDTKELPLVYVPTGFYGRIVAKDGKPLPTGQVIADAWPEDEFSKYLDASYFLEHDGQKGEQLSVLKPGVYPMNLALFEVRIGYVKNSRDIVKNNDDIYDMNGLTNVDTPLDTSIVRVPAGSVGVVRSSVQEKGKDCRSITTKMDESTNEGLVAELVPPGCKGIWNASLSPNDYYLNKDAYDVTIVSTRVTTIEFKGGYTRRSIDLKVDGKGDFVQTDHSDPIPQSGDDRAVNTKVEGWEIPQELRAVIQISPEHAPIVVAAVGGQKEVDDKIVIPSIRSHVRNVFGGGTITEKVDVNGRVVERARPIKVLDTIENRPTLENIILERMKIDGQKAGVDVKEIRLGEPVIPPELLLARQREQLATQLKAAFAQEQEAQMQRQQTEQARATADQQVELVKAQIGVKTAELAQQRRQMEGRGERLYLEEQTAGQKAQADVIGRENVVALQIAQRLMDLLREHPEIVPRELPKVYVSGASPLEASASIFGSFLSKTMTETVKSNGGPTTSDGKK